VWWSEHCQGSCSLTLHNAITCLPYVITYPLKGESQDWVCLLLPPSPAPSSPAGSPVAPTSGCQSGHCTTMKPCGHVPHSSCLSASCLGMRTQGLQLPGPMRMHPLAKEQGGDVLYHCCPISAVYAAAVLSRQTWLLAVLRLTFHNVMSICHRCACATCRACAGLRFALQEARLALVRLFDRFRFELGPSQEVPIKTRVGVTIGPLYGVRVRVFDRQAAK
jgi:hypothetical protein